jgi:hypothetical protein
MADHHDDRLDSALDLLRSRPWAGPRTHPLLEKQFMQPVDSRRPNLRLVLGIAGALIGCGAVAAATRPEVRAAIFGRTLAAAVHQVAQAPIAAPAAATAPERPAPAPAPVQARVAEAAPAPSPVAAAPTTEPGAEAAQGYAMVGDFEPALTEHDPSMFLQHAFAAYLERYMAGDEEACQALVDMVDRPPPWHAVVSGLQSGIAAKVHLSLMMAAGTGAGPGIGAGSELVGDHIFMLGGEGTEGGALLFKALMGAGEAAPASGVFEIVVTPQIDFMPQATPVQPPRR